MKILLDTNIIIDRESHYASNYSVSELFKWIDKLKYTKLVHPNTKEEISKYRDEKLRNSLLVKLESYETLVINNEFDERFNNVIKRYDISKHNVDDSMLYQAYIGRCDYLITEDKLMQKKAKELLIDNKVVSINRFLSICISSNPNLATYKHLPIEVIKFGDLDLKDTFFQSLINSYEGFERWVHKNANDETYVTKIENRMIGMLALKVEENENYDDIEPRFEYKKRLKIRTLKVESTGFRLAERYIQVALTNAKNQKVDEVYVTLFESGNALEKLKELFEKWGFVKHGYKGLSEKKELVYIKNMKAYDVNRSPRENYPLLNPKSYFILPIEPEYHTNLFPESQLLNEKQIYSNTANRFAIQKVYVSGVYDISGIKPGDIALIYRKGIEFNKRYTSVLTTLTVIYEIKKHTNIDEYIKECENRSVFTKEKLVSYFPKYSTIVKLLELKPLNKRVILDTLYKRGIIEENSGPRPFHRLTEDDFKYILNESKTEL